MTHTLSHILTAIPLLLLLTPLAAQAQTDGETPTFQPTMRVGRVMLEGDSVPYVELNRVYVYPPKTFRNLRERQRWDRQVWNVKRVLPLAKEIRRVMMETYEYLQTLPTKRARDEHLKAVERGVKEQYTPRMKKLTLTQGKLLIKLVYRECHSSSFDLINAFIGPLKAGFYQVFAWTFGASLRKTYDPDHSPDDAATERIARLVEAGQL